LEIRVDPVCFDSEGRWHPMQNDITSVLDLILPKKNDNVVKFKTRPIVGCLTEKQKDMLKVRFEKDFGLGSWDKLPPSYKINLWKNGRGGILV